MGRNVYTHRNSIQGRWTDATWSSFPRHELEKREPLPEYIYDLTPFEEKKPEVRVRKSSLIADTLKTEEEKPDLDSILKKKPEYLDERYVRKYKIDVEDEPTNK